MSAQRFARFGRIIMSCGLGILANVPLARAGQILIYSAINRSVTATVQTANPNGPNNDTQTFFNASTGIFNPTARAHATEKGGSGQPVTATSFQNSNIAAPGFSGNGSFTSGLGTQPNEFSSDFCIGDGIFETTFTVDAATGFVLDVGFAGGTEPSELGSINMQSATFTLNQGATTIAQGTMPDNPKVLFPPPTTTFHDEGVFLPGKSYSFDLSVDMQQAVPAGETFPEYSFKLQAVPVPSASGVALVTLLLIGTIGQLKRYFRDQSI